MSWLHDVDGSYQSPSGPEDLEVRGIVHVGVRLTITSHQSPVNR
jgi:hypothetical protein